MELADRITWSPIDLRGAGTRITSAIESPAALRALEWAMRGFLGSELDMVFSVLFMHLPKLVETPVVKDREATGPRAGMSFTTVGPPAIQPSLNERNGGNHERGTDVLKGGIGVTGCGSCH